MDGLITRIRQGFWTEKPTKQLKTDVQNLEYLECVYLWDICTYFALNGNNINK